MKRPKVSLENYREVYDYYQTHRQGPRAAKFLHGALSFIFKPSIQYEAGALDSVRELMDQKRTIVLASNHTRAVDPCIIASLPVHDETLRPLLGNAFIPAKRSIQAIPGVRHLVDGLGAVPTFRQKDVKSQKDAERLSGASRALMKTAIVRMESGQHMAVFPEGERNKTEPTRVQSLQKGIGLMVCRVSQIEQPAIVPMAIHYGGDTVQDYRHPQVYIGKPSAEPFSRGRDIMDWLPMRLQHCVDMIQATNV